MDIPRATVRRQRRQNWEAMHGQIGTQRLALRGAGPPGRVTLTIHDLLVQWGPSCCWCQRPTRLDVDPNHPLRSTIEHLLPKSRGGRDDAANLRVACYQCNNKRGDSLGPP